MIGKLGPTRIQDSTATPDGNQTLLLDDNTGRDGGFALPQWFTRQMKTAFVTGAPLQRLRWPTSRRKSG